MFPSKKYKRYVKQINNASLFVYGSKCWRTKKPYQKAGHKVLIQKSRKYKVRLKRVQSKEKETEIETRFFS